MARAIVNAEEAAKVLADLRSGRKGTRKPRSQSSCPLNRGSTGRRSSDKVSNRTAQAYKRAYTLAARWAENHGEKPIDQWDHDIANRYLEHRSTEVGQKALNQDIIALECLPHIANIDKIKSSVHVKRNISDESRAYTQNQISAIVDAQSTKHAIATLIASEAGLRPHELYTLLPAAERSADGGHVWMAERFAGIEGTRYTVIGNDEIVREVMLTISLANQLEVLRLDTPALVVDRGVNYKQNYAVGAGVNWSASFTRVSQVQLGYSYGAYGLRHGYAQRRFETLSASGRIYNSVLLVLCQELGLSSVESVEKYLR